MACSCLNAESKFQGHGPGRETVTGGFPMTVEIVTPGSKAVRPTDTGGRATVTPVAATPAASNPVRPTETGGRQTKNPSPAAPAVPYPLRPTETGDEPTMKSRGTEVGSSGS